MINPKVQNLIQTHFLYYDAIASERRKELEDLAIWMQQQLLKNRYLNTIVICTHNSRRSHLGQILLAIAADYFKLTGLNAYSGGTQATAFNTRMINALQKEGLEFTLISPGDNPIYNVTWGDSEVEKLTGVCSKIYTDKINPQENFLALMVCDSAAQYCPVVIGNSKRVALTYQDPKDFDDTELESKAYQDKIYEMGREFFYLIHHLKNMVSPYQ